MTMLASQLKSLVVTVGRVYRRIGFQEELNNVGMAIGCCFTKRKVGRVGQEYMSLEDFYDPQLAIDDDFKQSSLTVLCRIKTCTYQNIDHLHVAITTCHVQGSVPTKRGIYQVICSKQRYNLN